MKSQRKQEEQTSHRYKISKRMFGYAFWNWLSGHCDLKLPLSGFNVWMNRFTSKLLLSHYLGLKLLVSYQLQQNWLSKEKKRWLFTPSINLNWKTYLQFINCVAFKRCHVWSLHPLLRLSKFTKYMKTWVAKVIQLRAAEAHPNTIFTWLPPTLLQLFA